MESIFESLENLNVSEECFNEIMGIVEEILSESESLRGIVQRAYDSDKISQKELEELDRKAMNIPKSKTYKRKGSGYQPKGYRYMRTSNSGDSVQFADDIDRKTLGSDDISNSLPVRKSIGRHYKKTSKTS